MQIFCWKNEQVSWIEVKIVADAGIKLQVNFKIFERLAVKIITD